jgi:hypothetical protein
MNFKNIKFNWFRYIAFYIYILGFQAGLRNGKIWGCDVDVISVFIASTLSRPTI